MDIRIKIDFGLDRGQGWGSLFEAKDADGKVVAGAGFAHVYNTAFANDRFDLQFYLRDGKSPMPEFEPLPRSTSDAGAYLFDLDGGLHAKSLAGLGRPNGWFVMDVDLPPDAAEKQLQVWESEHKRWNPSLRMDGCRMRIGDAMMRIGDGVLSWADSRVEFDGELILPPPSEGIYHHFHYAQGHLFFFHRQSGRIDIHACPYTPHLRKSVDLKQSIRLQLPRDREFPFAYGQWRDHLLICTNLGGTYRFTAGVWETLRQPNNQSYQIYSALNFRDKLLLAHYPSGHLMEYTGEAIVELPDAPPMLPGVSAEVREAQTTIVYGGDLYAGVWPWAELWRMDGQTGRWEYLRRLFDHPPLTQEFAHPYEREIGQYNATAAEPLVANGWGQRLTSMVPIHDSLMLGTSAKWNWSAATPSPFLSAQQRQDYGRVTRMTIPGVLTASVRWKPHPTEIRLVAVHSHMRILQDDAVLGQREIPPALPRQTSPAHITWRQGAYGGLAADMIEHEAHL